MCIYNDSCVSILSQNWIRNRRRPTAARTAEKIANLISTNSMPPPPPAVLPLAHAIPSVSSAPISVTPVTLPTHPPPNIVDMSAAPPSAKRPHMEQSEIYMFVLAKGMHMFWKLNYNIAFVFYQSPQYLC